MLSGLYICATLLCRARPNFIPSMLCTSRDRSLVVLTAMFWSWTQLSLTTMVIFYVVFLRFNLVSFIKPAQGCRRLSWSVCTKRPSLWEKGLLASLRENARTSLNWCTYVAATHLSKKLVMRIAIQCCEQHSVEKGLQKTLSYISHNIFTWRCTWCPSTHGCFLIQSCALLLSRAEHLAFQEFSR